MPDKYRVTMRNAVASGFDTDGRPVVQVHEAVDHVPVDILDAYVADARTRWQSVETSDEPDHGPGGVDGPTAVLTHLTGV